MVNSMAVWSRYANRSGSVNCSMSESTKHAQKLCSKILSFRSLLHEKLHNAGFFLAVFEYIYLYAADLFILMQLLTIISSIDDLNYPEKTNTYYIVNTPYIFSTCWKVKDIIPYDFVSCTISLLYMAVYVDHLLRPQHDVKRLALAGCEATFTREDKKKSAGVTRLWTR